MPSVTYIGPHAEVEIPALGVVVKNGESFEAGELAAALLEQENNFKSSKGKPAAEDKGE